MRAGRQVATCPECGCPAAARLSDRGSVMESHDPGGKLCRAAGWAREAAERGLVRVQGEDITDLSNHTAVVYGPYYLTREEVEREAAAGGWGRPQRKPGVVTAAWAPRWAVVLNAGYGHWWGPGKKRAFARAEADPEWREALLSVADLASGAADLRTAVLAFCKESLS